MYIYLALSGNSCGTAVQDLTGSLGKDKGKFGREDL